MSTNDKPTQRDIQANGIRLRITEQGSGPLVLLCHGWPELAHSWRHQIPALAAAGYRVVAPDMRGYGGSSVPQEVTSYAITDLVGDMVALVQALGETRAAIVGHDWGAAVAWHAALMRPDLFSAVAAMSVPHQPRHPAAPPMAVLRTMGLTDFYWFHFCREGVPEAEFEADIDTALRKVFGGLLAKPGQAAGASMMVPEGQGFLDRISAPQQLPHWLDQADLDVFAAAFRANGFRGPFNWYRNLDANWVLTAPFQGARVQPPALFIGGTHDAFLASPIGQRALDKLAASVPLLRDVLLIPGAGHWIQQECPQAVNEALLRFLQADYPA